MDQVLYERKVVKMSLTMKAGAVLACIGFVVVLVAFIIYQIRIAVPERRLRLANMYFFAAVAHHYFYGHSVKECLKKNVVARLREEGIGDFARQFGVLALCALDDPKAALYYRQDRGGTKYDDKAFYVAVVCFSYQGKNWQIALHQNLGVGEEPTVAPAIINAANFDGCIRLHDLTEEKRSMLEGCEDPERSNWMPDTRYGNWDRATNAEYAHRVEDEVARIFCPVEIERTPL